MEMCNIKPLLFGI